MFKMAKNYWNKLYFFARDMFSLFCFAFTTGDLFYSGYQGTDMSDIRKALLTVTLSFTALGLIRGMRGRSYGWFVPTTSVITGMGLGFVFNMYY